MQTTLLLALVAAGALSIADGFNFHNLRPICTAENANLTDLLRRSSPVGLTSIRMECDTDIHGAFTTTIPAEIGQYTHLTSLILKGGFIYGTLPPQMSALTQLKHLEITETDIDGSIPTQLGSMSKLTLLNLSHSALDGTFPDSFSSTTDLEVLDLSFPSDLDFSMIFGIGNLTSLRELYLRDMDFEIVDGVSALTNLRIVDVSGSSGTIADGFFDLTGLTELYLASIGSGMFTSSELAQLTQLTTLDLSWNSHTKVPSEVGSLAALKRLDMSNCELDALDSIQGTMSSLTSFDISGNDFTGTIVGDWTYFPALKALNIAGNDVHALDPTITQLTSLVDLDISENSLSSYPPPLSLLTHLTKLNLARNGDADNTFLLKNIETLTALRHLDASFVNLYNIPSKISALTSLTFFSAASAEPFLMIPSEFFQLTNLEWLDLSNCQITSEFPESISRLSNLIYLDLSGNDFHSNSEAPAMSFLADVYYLVHLDLSNNPNLMSTLSFDDFDFLEDMAYLDLSNTSLVGTLPSSINSMTDLAFFTMAYNSLSGSIPALADFRRLRTLDFRNNSFSSALPNINASVLTSLYSLNLAGNALDSSVPSELAQLGYSLRDLDLSYNMLTRTIPSSLSSMALMTAFSVNDNMLSGPVTTAYNSALTSLKVADNCFTGIVPVSLTSIAFLDVTTDRKYRQGKPCPTQAPTLTPTTSPTPKPTSSPSKSPSKSPSVSPSKSPSVSPSVSPSKSPSTSPSVSPSKSPSTSPTASPSTSPSVSPSASPSSSPSLSPSASPSTSPSLSPSKSPSTSPTQSPSTSPTANPTASPTAVCDPGPRRVFVALDRTYASNVREKLQFGVEVLRELIDDVNQVDFLCTEMVFASLLRDGFSWMVAPTNPARSNGTELGASARNEEIGADWRSGFSQRSLTLASVLDEGALTNFCGQGNSCHLIVVTDGKFRSSQERDITAAALQQAAVGLNFETTCIFPSRRDTRRGLNLIEGACEYVYHPGTTTATAAGSDIAMRIMGRLLV